jgi:hypothetical protein
MAMIPDAAADGVTAPGGLGFASGTVGSTGVITLNGQLGDAQKVALSLGLSATGQAIIWSQPYRNKASFIGGIITIGHLGNTVRGLSTERAEAGLSWVRLPDSSEASYPGGFSFHDLTGRTSRWYPAPDADALAGSLGLDDSRAIFPYFHPADIPALPARFILGDNFSLTANPPTPRNWLGSVARSGGTFSGTMKIPLVAPATATASAAGVFLQDEEHGETVGAGLVKIPLAAGTTNPPFRTTGLLLEQE